MGGLFKSKNETTTKSSQSGTNKTTPILTPTASNLNALMEEFIQQRFAGPALPAGFEERGVGSISNAFGFANQNLINNATARGMGDSPGLLAALQSSGADRASQIGQFQSSIPMLEQQQRERDFLQAMGLFSAQPVGQQGQFSQEGSSYAQQVSTPSPFSIMMGLGSLAAGAFGGGIGGLFGGGTAGGGATSGMITPQSTGAFTFGGNPASAYGFNNLIR